MSLLPPSDGARWRALMASARLHYMGSAGFDINRKPDTPIDTKQIQDCVAVHKPGQTMHFGMEFWDHFPTGSEAPIDNFERSFMIEYTNEILKQKPELTTEPNLMQFVRDIIDATWSYAYEDQSVPSTEIQNKIIDRVVGTGRS